MSTTTVAQYTKYKVKDLSLPNGAEKKYKLAEAEMPGLMALRKEYGQRNL